MSEIKGLVKVMPFEEVMVGRRRQLRRQWQATKDTVYWGVIAAYSDATSEEVDMVSVPDTPDIDTLLTVRDMAMIRAVEHAEKHGLSFIIKGTPDYDWMPKRCTR